MPKRCGKKKVDYMKTNMYLYIFKVIIFTNKPWTILYVSNRDTISKSVKPKKGNKSGTKVITE